MITIPKGMTSEEKGIWYKNLTPEEKEEFHIKMTPKLIETGKYYDLVQRLSLFDLNDIKPVELQVVHTGDCTIKSVSCVLGLEYTKVYKEIFELAMKNYYMPNDTYHVIAPYIAKYGWLNHTTFDFIKPIEVGELITKYEDRELLISCKKYGSKSGESAGHMFGYKNHTVYNYPLELSGVLYSVDSKMALTILMECKCYAFFMKTKGL